jgi:hypothetical protein
MATGESQICRTPQRAATVSIGPWAVHMSEQSPLLRSGRFRSMYGVTGNYSIPADSASLQSTLAN